MKHHALSSNQLRKLYWDKQQSIPEISKALGISKDILYQLMQKHQIPRRDGTESNYLVFKRKPPFKVRENLNSEEQKLKVAGIMLYWAEGAQTGNFVDFSNSKPEMIQVFLKFLREICGIHESRLRVYLYLHGDVKDAESVIQFWNKITQIPRSQFLHPYIRRKEPNYKGRVMPYGLVHIRYSDKRLLELIQQWICSYSSAVIRAGTQAVNGARL